MITLYHCERARSFRVLWFLEECNLPYQLEMLPFPPRVHAKEYLGLNPLGTVPLMLDGVQRMTESVAICQYLVGRYGKDELAVAADEDDYASYLNLMHYGESTLTFPLAVYLRYTRVEPEARRLPQAAQDYWRFFLGRLRSVEALLADNRTYLCAGRFTIADISVGYALLFAERNGQSHEIPGNIMSYLSRLKERPGFLRAIQAENTAAL